MHIPSITAVETAVWSECPRTVRNRLFMTVLGHSLHTAVVETLYLFFSINDILQIHLYVFV
ncbi:unnamed protein product, partial [Staurois parvus]